MPTEKLLLTTAPAAALKMEVALPRFKVEVEKTTGALGVSRLATFIPTPFAEPGVLSINTLLSDGSRLLLDKNMSIARSVLPLASRLLQLKFNVNGV